MSVLRLLATCMALCVGFGAAAPAERPVASDAAAWAADASSSFDEGAALIRSDKARADNLLRRSIASYRRVIDEGGTQNAGLYYNIANAFALMGDDGRAIVNYRRAERFAPGDPNLRANLALVLGRVPDRVAPTPGDRMVRTLLFWHFDLSAPARFWIFVSASGLAWLLGIGRAAGVLRFGVAPWMLGFLAIAGLFLGSVLVDQAAPGRAAEAVIVDGPVVGRKGPDIAGYQPTFKDPLHPGVEVRLVERRGDWALVRLADDRETWLPGQSLELLWPAEPRR